MVTTCKPQQEENIEVDINRNNDKVIRSNSGANLYANSNSPTITVQNKVSSPSTSSSILNSYLENHCNGNEDAEKNKRNNRRESITTIKKMKNNKTNNRNEEINKDCSTMQNNELFNSMSIRTFSNNEDVTEDLNVFRKSQ